MRPGSSGSEDISTVWQSMKGGITYCTTCGGITEGCLEVHPTLTMPLLALQGRKVMQMMVGTPKAAQQQDSSSSRSSTITTLPAPTDPAVRLAVSGGEVVAVMPFEGYITPEAAASVRQQLAKALEKGEGGRGRCRGRHVRYSDCCMLLQVSQQRAEHPSSRYTFGSCGAVIW